jgi:hypothetical protein
MRHLDHLGYYAVAADQLDLAVRNTRVLARDAVTLVRDKEQRREGLSRRSWDSPLRWRLSPGTWSSRNQPLDVREFALEAAREATAVPETSTDLETSAALVAQIRSTATDLLQGAGMGSDEALKALGEASRLGSRE